jgi:hypothetical protein
MKSNSPKVTRQAAKSCRFRSHSDYSVNKGPSRCPLGRYFVGRRIHGSLKAAKFVYI